MRIGLGGNTRVVLCEPHFTGYEHATFNAGMIASVLEAWPAASVTVLAEPTHLRMVREELERHTVEGLLRCEWCPVPVRKRNTAFRLRFTAEIRTCLAAMRRARQAGTEALLFLSANTTFLAILKLAMAVSRSATPVVVAPHDLLYSLAEKPAQRLAKRFRSFRTVLLSWPHPPALHYIALGGRIAERVGGFVPQAGRWFREIDPPYLFGTGEEMTLPTSPGVLRFGYLGVSRKGFDTFVWLAKETGRLRPGKATFVMVGFVNDGRSDTDLAEIQRTVEGVGCIPLSPEEFASRCRSLTYVVGTALPEAYQLRACATFLDALAYGKPALHLRNPWIEYYLERIPGAGWVCDGQEDLLQHALQMIDRHSPDAYSTQVAQILRGRGLFSPVRAGGALKAIVAEMKGLA